MFQKVNTVFWRNTLLYCISVFTVFQSYIRNSQMQGKFVLLRTFFNSMVTLWSTVHRCLSICMLFYFPFSNSSSGDKRADSSLRSVYSHNGPTPMTKTALVRCSLCPAGSRSSHPSRYERRLGNLKKYGTQTGFQHHLFTTPSAGCSSA